MILVFQILKQKQTKKAPKKQKERKTIWEV
jgi:hypothetical protein